MFVPLQRQKIECGIGPLASSMCSLFYTPMFTPKEPQARRDAPAVMPAWSAFRPLTPLPGPFLFNVKKLVLPTNA